MRAAPAFQVTLRHFGVWRISIGALAAGGLACLGAWAMSRDLPIGWLLGATLMASVVAVVGLAVSLCRVLPVSLRWDGLCWHLGQPDAISDDARPGDLRSIIDLGPWMLLRFTAADSPPTWLPVQRRGLEAQWHALRCSVYSPRPSPAEPSPAKGVPAENIGRP
jgi:hypothetical protein